MAEVNDGYVSPCSGEPSEKDRDVIFVVVAIVISYAMGAAVMHSRVCGTLFNKKRCKRPPDWLTAVGEMEHNCEDCEHSTFLKGINV